MDNPSVVKLEEAILISRSKGNHQLAEALFVALEEERKKDKFPIIRK